MSNENSVRAVKDFFGALGSGDKERVLALVTEDIEWIIPGEDWPRAGTHRGHAGLSAGLVMMVQELSSRGLVCTRLGGGDRSWRLSKRSFTSMSSEQSGLLVLTRLPRSPHAPPTPAHRRCSTPHPTD